MIEIRVTGLEDLTNATGEMKKWGERPFDGVASFYIRKNWMDRIDRAFVTKGQSIGRSGSRFRPHMPPGRVGIFPVVHCSSCAAR